MRQKSVPVKEPATQVVKNIRRATRRHFSADDKIRIVLEASTICCATHSAVGCREMSGVFMAGDNVHTLPNSVR